MVKFIAIFLLLCGQVFADDILIRYSDGVKKMKLVNYEEVSDCKYPSAREKIFDKDGHYLGVMVKQDIRCE